MCWLCEENKTRLLGFIGDTAIMLGKDKDNKIAFVQKYNWHRGLSLYNPKFCPECGKDLSKAIESKIIVYGMCNKSFYVVQSHDNGNYYSIWYINKAPVDMTNKGIEDFMLENTNDGVSVAGSYRQIMDEFLDFIDKNE